MAREAVIINVYWLNFGCGSTLTKSGLSVYHSGIEVYGTEFTYGQCNAIEPISGVVEMTPRGAEKLDKKLIFKQAIHLGYTDLTELDVIRITTELGTEDFRGDKYHVLSRNCNHFSNALAEILCGKKIPSWINRLARIGQAGYDLYFLWRRKVQVVT